MWFYLNALFQTLMLIIIMLLFDFNIQFKVFWKKKF